MDMTTNIEWLQVVWFALWGVLWAAYFMLDGFDLGLGMLLPVLGKSNLDRRFMYNAMGPFWDGNEVWLITAGGVTFAAFPGTYAVMFSALYTPLMMILFGLIIRGVAFEFRAKVDDPRWRAMCDGFLIVGSSAVGLLFGVAFANIFRGVPIDAAGVFQGNLFDLLNPYGILGGVLFVLMFVTHGALWLWIRTRGELSDRAHRMAFIAWPVLTIVAVTFLVASAFATTLWANYLTYPFLFAVPALAVIGLLAAGWFIWKRQAWLAWASSSLFIVGATLYGVAGLFPNLLPSSIDANASMTAFNSSSSPLTLSIMLGVAGVMVPVVIAYQSWVYWRFSAPLTQKDLVDGESY